MSNTAIISRKTVARVTKGGAAEQALEPGLTFDTALPQPWVDAMYERGFDNVAAHFVWAYPKGDPFGYPHAVTYDGLVMLGKSMWRG